jgi:hypothetical protein
MELLVAEHDVRNVLIDMTIAMAAAVAVDLSSGRRSKVTHRHIVLPG